MLSELSPAQWAGVNIQGHKEEHSSKREQKPEGKNKWKILYVWEKKKKKATVEHSEQR